jgi:hypothetical protein
VVGLFDLRKSRIWHVELLKVYPSTRSERRSLPLSRHFATDRSAIGNLALVEIGGLVQISGLPIFP